MAAQLPTSDIDDDGYDANGWVMRFFLDDHDGMIQADGEGFYDRDKLDWDSGSSALRPAPPAFARPPPHHVPAEARPLAGQMAAGGQFP